MVDAVSDAQLRRYLEVCGYPADATALPATYPHILAWPPMFRLLRGRDFPLPLIGLVHIGNVIEQCRPLSTQDKFDFTVRWENLREHERGRAVDVVTQASVDGQHVWRETSSYLRRSRRPAGGADRGPAKAEIPQPDQVWRVTPEIASNYARVSGDRNPIHTSTIVARLFGFPGRIAHGMWSLARCLAELNLPEDSTVDASFKLPVVLPAEVAFTARPDGFELRDARTGRPHVSGRVLGSQV
jgi:acyl dehydratase